MYHVDLLRIEYELANHPIFTCRTSLEKILDLLELQLLTNWQPCTIQEISPNRSKNRFQGHQKFILCKKKLNSVQKRIDDILLRDEDRNSYHKLLLETIQNYNVNVPKYERAMSWVLEGSNLELPENATISEEIVRLIILKQTAIASNKDHLIAAALNYNRIDLLPFNFLKELSINQPEVSMSFYSTDSKSKKLSNREFSLVDFMDKPPHYPDITSIEVMTHYCLDDHNKWSESHLIGKLILESKIKIFDLAYKRINREYRSVRKRMKADVA